MVRVIPVSLLEQLEGNAQNHESTQKLPFLISSSGGCTNSHLHIILGITQDFADITSFKRSKILYSCSSAVASLQKLLGVSSSVFL